VPARDDLRPLYVTGHGLSLGKSGEVLQIRERNKPLQEVRIGKVSQVNVFGNVQSTAAAIQGLCGTEKPISHFSYGWLVLRSNPWFGAEERLPAQTAIRAGRRTTVLSERGP
jgi:CRISPR associated protein, Cas1 family